MRCLVKVHAFLFVWFDSLHPINNLSDIKGRVYLGWTSAKLGVMCLAQRHNAVTLVSLEPAVPRSWVKHSTTEPLHQQITEEDPNLKLWNTTDIFIKMSIIRLWCNNASWSLILCEGPHYSCIQLINLTMPFPNFDKGPKKVILQKVPLEMTWWHDYRTLILSILLELLYAVTK